MKYLICSDSFKGSITSKEACAVIESALREKDRDCRIDSIVFADGGEGSIDAFCDATEAARVQTTVVDMYARRRNADIAVKGETALIEVAQTDYIDPYRADMLSASSYGVGMQIKAALDFGAKSIFLCAGGSGTTDAGIGMAKALGACFFDSDDEHISTDALGLFSLDRIDFSGLDKRIFSTELVLVSDVKAPLYGANGAAFVFAPQKGADKQTVLRLDKALRNFSETAKRCLDKDVSTVAGAGAAGGIGAMAWLMGAKIVSGSDFFLDLAQFDRHAVFADVIITGEGMADGQSVMGKAVGSIASRARGKHIVCFCGAMGEGVDKLIEAGISEIYCITPDGEDTYSALRNGKDNLYRAVINYEAP